MTSLSDTHIDSSVDIRVTMIRKLLEFFEAEQVSYCVMGDTTAYDSTIDSDVDIVLSCSSLRSAPNLLSSFCEKHGCHLFQQIRHEVTASYFVIGGHENQKKVWLMHPDICCNYMRGGKLYLTADEILADRQRRPASPVYPRGFYIAHPNTEFLYYLIKRISKGHISESGLNHICEQWEKSDQAAVLKRLEAYWPCKQDRDLIRQAITTQNWTVISESLPRLQRELRRSRTQPLVLSILEVLRVLSRLVRPTGILVAFFGPDGSGKSSVISGVDATVKHAFRKTYYAHLRPRLGQKDVGGEVVTDPHGKPPRGRLSSFGKLGYLAFDYILGYLMVIRPMMVRSTMVIFDRYYHDMLVDPQRYRLGVSSRIPQLVEKLIPRPDLIILLDAPAEVLQARKQEVSAEESARQREKYRTVLSEFPECVIVDASQPLEKVVAAANEVILNFLDRRTRKGLHTLRAP